jgi:kynureninase
LRTEDIISTIEKHCRRNCLSIVGGINYTVNFLKKIARAAVGAKVSFDLAHAAGNVNYVA